MTEQRRKPQVNTVQPQSLVAFDSPRKKMSDFTYDNKFSYPFCSCCVDCKLCCCGTFCLPCLICDLYKDAKEGSCSACWQCFTYSILIKPLCCCCSNLSMLRTKIRGAYKLHGSIQEDIFYTGCCPCCAAIQLKLEMRTQGIAN
ncbi:unnamed protein product [Brachionus calyciflorus]|uniref:Uncharacterized protein n=1 Tax=Brachionus calyciflorus TaxID=104777 RepID=A0A813P2R2_9BILA|nr:unnamed protein product [Brachionus calyciflorus]